MLAWQKTRTRCCRFLRTRKGTRQLRTWHVWEWRSAPQQMLSAGGLQAKPTKDACTQQGVRQLCCKCRCYHAVTHPIVMRCRRVRRRKRVAVEACADGSGGHLVDDLRLQLQVVSYGALVSKTGWRTAKFRICKKTPACSASCLCARATDNRAAPPELQPVPTMRPVSVNGTQLDSWRAWWRAVQGLWLTKD